MAADFLQFAGAGEIDSPVLAPSFFDQNLEQRRIFLQADQIGGYLSQLYSLLALVERLAFFFVMEEQGENADVAGGVEDGVKRLEIVAQQREQAILRAFALRRPGDRGLR